MKTTDFLLMRLLTVFFAAVLAAPNSKAEPSTQVFNEALVLLGGGADWPTYLGVFDGMRERGVDPDLLVGVCGGAVAAALIYTQPETDFSSADNVRVGFDFVRNIKIRTGFLPAYANVFLNQGRWFKADQIAPVMAPTILNIPRLGEVPDLNRKFESNGKRRLLILATRLLYDPVALRRDLAKKRGAQSNSPHEPPRPNIPDPSRNGRKLFRLTIFTDKETATVLRSMNLKAKPALAFPDSALDTTIDIVDDVTIGDAVQASISDPFLTRPAKIGEDYYMTGATDNYPVELIHGLAKSITHTFSYGLSAFENGFFKSVFKYDSNRNIEKTKRELVARWVLLSPQPPALRAHTMNVAVDKWTLSLKSRFPTDFARFTEAYSAYYEFGRERARQTVKYAPYELDPLTLRGDTPTN